MAVAVHIGYDEALAHRIFSATDITFVPSRYEPCGLTQMYGLKYGSLPLVHRVGGLADTVVDANAANLSHGVANGFVFDEFTHAGIHGALLRALELFRMPDRWATVVNHAMQHELGWRESAAKYASLYAAIVKSL
jgi:starch synthase